MSRRRRFQLSIVNYWSSCSKSYLADWVDAIEGWMHSMSWNYVWLSSSCWETLWMGLFAFVLTLLWIFLLSPWVSVFQGVVERIFLLCLWAPKYRVLLFFFWQPLCLFTALNSLWNSPGSRCRHVSYCRSTLLWSLEICCLCVTYYRKASLSAQILQAMQGGLLYFGFKSLFPEESSKCKCNPCLFLFCCETCVCELNSLLILSYIVMR